MSHSPHLALPPYYETVAASQTGQVFGSSTAGAGKGTYLERLIIVPATTSPGAVTIIDNATSISVFAGGASSINELRPIVVELGMAATAVKWSITTGANVSVIAVGRAS